MSELFKCTSCRHHMQMAPESEETCMACFNQDNWEPPKEDIHRLVGDCEMLIEANDGLEAEVEKLKGSIGEVHYTNELLRNENTRLRSAYGSTT